LKVAVRCQKQLPVRKRVKVAKNETAEIVCPPGRVVSNIAFVSYGLPGVNNSILYKCVLMKTYVLHWYRREMMDPIFKGGVMLLTLQLK
jgi:hypothetical protein